MGASGKRRRVKMGSNEGFWRLSFGLVVVGLSVVFSIFFMVGGLVMWVEE